MGTLERIETVLTIICDAAKETRVAVVVSAFQKVTDQLIGLAQQAKNGESDWSQSFTELHDRHIGAVQTLIAPKHQTAVLSAVKKTLNELEDTLRGIALIRECSPRSLDFVMSFGERLSAFIVAHTLESRGVDAFFVDAREVVSTNADHGDAKIDFEKTYRQINDHLKNRKGIPVFTGFIGRSEDGSTTTIGRSGSDYTGSIVGAALNVELIEIWTDVDGVMSADPRRVKDAFVIDRMSYEEAMELSHFGAKVIHPQTMTPAVEASIPIVIKNTFNPPAPGTVISKQVSDHVVVGISSIDQVVLMNVEGGGMMGIPGIAQRLFGALARHRVSVILIAQASSEHSICFAVSEKDEPAATQAVEEEFKLEMQVGHVEKLQTIRDVSILAVVGSNMSGRRGTAGTLFRALGENGVNVIAIAQGLSELNISFIVNRDEAEIALNVVHQAFFLSKQKHVHLFIAGVGTIGGELLDQLHHQHDKLKEELGLDVHVVGLASSQKSIVDPEGIPLEKWRDTLELSGQNGDARGFLEAIQTFRKGHAIFVDCTAGEDWGNHYLELLSAHVPVVTPNKKFNARPYAEYKKAREVMRESGAGFYYETNVGAGLPIIETMKDLMKSGDHIVKIEGILSGTLSFIFNHFNGEKPFSDVVRLAQEKGYTEPDPRDDLSGTDVARKLLILGREMGLKLEMEDIVVESVVPESCRENSSVEEFYEALKKEDPMFAQRWHDANRGEGVLRYVASIENGKASVALKKVSLTHPFASLRGSDNVVSLSTRRYNETPLVVQGPGAGPGVTAGGVFADILRAAHQFS